MSIFWGLINSFSLIALLPLDNYLGSSLSQMLKKQTIVFTVTNDLSYDQRMDRICTTLSNNGYEVRLVGRRKKDSIPLVSKIYNQHRLTCFFQKGKFFYLEYNLRLFFYLLFVKADIFSSVDLDTILPCWTISKFRNKKFVYDSHEYYTEVIEVVNRPAIKKVWEAIEAFILSRAKYAYTVCENIKREYEQKYPIKFEVIRNVPSLMESETEGKTEKVLIYIGAVNEGRGLDELIEALYSTDYKLWICGKGDVFDLLTQKVHLLGMDKQVQFLGYVEPEKLREITKKAYAGYLLLRKESLSYYYSLANKFFDYIHAGIPQIVIDFPEYRLINQKHEVALLTDLNKESIRANLDKLWNDELLYERLKQNTFAARMEYNWQKESVKLVAFYEKVARGGDV